MTLLPYRRSLQLLPTRAFSKAIVLEYAKEWPLPARECHTWNVAVLVARPCHWRFDICATSACIFG